MKKRCLALSKADRAADLAWAFSVPDVGGPKRCSEIVVNDLESARIGIIDADLLPGELMLDQLVFDPLVGE